MAVEALRAARYLAKPIPVKPSRIIPQVEGSGTADGSARLALIRMLAPGGGTKIGSTAAAAEAVTDVITVDSICTSAGTISGAESSI
jgi:hypothetical protein